MKMKNLFVPLAVAGALSFVASCDEADTSSYMPTFEGFVYEKPVVPGDSLLVTAKQSELGRLLGHTEYTWTCLYSWTDTIEGTSGQRDTLFVKTQKLNYSADNSDPQIKFLVPAIADNLTLTFEAEYNYAGQGELRYDGSNTGGGGSANGYIRPVTSNNLFGLTKGSVTIRW